MAKDYQCPRCKNPVDRAATVCSNVECRAALAFCSHCRDVTTYELDPEAMAKDYPALLDAGCNIVGGCCGSGPEHIRLIASVARARVRR